MNKDILCVVLGGLSGECGISSKDWVAQGNNYLGTRDNYAKLVLAQPIMQPREKQGWFNKRKFLEVAEILDLQAILNDEGKPEPVWYDSEEEPIRTLSDKTGVILEYDAFSRIYRPRTVIVNDGRVFALPEYYSSHTLPILEQWAKKYGPDWYRRMNEVALEE